jgi:hypothetical protein
LITDSDSKLSDVVLAFAETQAWLAAGEDPYEL